MTVRAAEYRGVPIRWQIVKLDVLSPGAKASTVFRTASGLPF
jgi:hypothetical protein